MDLGDRIELRHGRADVGGYVPAAPYDQSREFASASYIQMETLTFPPYHALVQVLTSDSSISSTSLHLIPK